MNDRLRIKINIVEKATNNFTKIISTNEIIENYPELYWGGNGIGDRWINKQFNYTVIYLYKKTTTYSENNNDRISTDILDQFFEIYPNDSKISGIIGIFVHSKRTNINKRGIRNDICKTITSSFCVVCGTHKTICDHKNDLYNDQRVLNLNTQLLQDFQPLCNHCNLQKRQVCKVEKCQSKLYSAKNIPKYKIYPFEFPWEKKNFNIDDINCKNETYWFDPVEFEKKIYYYSISVYLIITEIKKKVKSNQIKLIS